MLQGPGGRSAAPPRPAATPAPTPRQAASNAIGNIGRTFVQAVSHVFAAQPPAQKQAIVRAAAANPQHPAAQALRQLGIGAKGPSIAQTGKPWQSGVATNPKSGGGIGDVLRGLESLVPANPVQQLGMRQAFGTTSEPQAILNLGSKAAGVAAAGVGDLRALSRSVPVVGKPTAQESVLGNVNENFAKNVASDAANLAGAPITTLATVAKDVTHPQSLVNDFIAFPKQMIEHPVASLEQHPLLSLAVGQGAAAGLSRLGAAPVRALAPEDSAVGRALSTNREGVWLTGKLTHERAPYSKAPSVKAQQVGSEKGYLERGPGGQLIPARNEMGAQLRKRWINQGVGELVGLRERVRRVGQAEVKASHYNWFSPGWARKAAHNAKNALAIGPEHAAVPGAEVAHLIADGTVGRPETYAQDLAAYRDLISRNRPELVKDVQDKLPNAETALKVHDANVKLLNHEIAANRSPKSLKAVFDAVNNDRAAYLPLEAKRLAYGDYGADMTQAALDRRALYGYAATHLGARVIEDPAKMAEYEKFKQSVLKDENLSFGQKMAQLQRARPQSQLMTNHPEGPRALSTGELRARALAHTGGRMPTYVAEHVHPDLRDNPNSAFYVPGEERPRAGTQKNTLYAYTHGLVNLGHTALLERRARSQNIVDAHETQNLLVDQLANQLPGGGYASTYAEAKKAAPKGMMPFNLARPFHEQDALTKAFEAGNVDPLAAEEEAVRRGIELQHRTEDHGPGKYGLIDRQALKALNSAKGNISPDIVSRGFRSLNNQFRTVVLATSAKHVPGVLFENLIRDIAHGVGLRSWLTGQRALGSLKQQFPEQYRQIRTHLTGGQAAGMTEVNRVYSVADHWDGTAVHPFLKGMEAFFKAPGARQLRTAWRGWTKIAISGIKKLLEEQHQIAGLGKGLLREHGYAEAAKLEGFVGLFHRALGLHGRMLDDATRGLVDPAKARQMRKLINQMYGKWTDLSPHGQRALMFSPFGLWWVNSARFLLRAPIDMPVKTGLLASATASTQKRRQAIGEDLLAPGALPGYEIGGIPVGGKDIAQNYYSPFGTVNDPLATGASLFEPWLTGISQGLAGLNFLNKPLESPGNPRGYLPVTGSQKVQAVLDSVFSSFVPLYTKAAQLAEGGASPFDVTDTGVLPPLLEGKAPPTKQPGKGLVAGVKKAMLPFREYKLKNAAGSSGSGYFAGSSSASSSGSGGTGYFGGGGSSSGSSGSGYFGGG